MEEQKVKLDKFDRAEIKRNQKIMSHKIVILSGAGGVGKSTIIKYLCTNYPNKFRETVSCTTRPKRDYEVDHVNYHFLSEDEFQDKIEAGEFVEFNKFPNGFMYGTLYSEILDVLEKCNVIMDIDVATAQKVKENEFYKMLNVVTIFIDADEEILMDRLRIRGASPDELWQRIVVSREERKLASTLDHIIVNETVEDSAKQIIKIIN